MIRFVIFFFGNLKNSYSNKFRIQEKNFLFLYIPAISYNIQIMSTFSFSKTKLLAVLALFGFAACNGDCMFFNI